MPRYYASINLLSSLCAAMSALGLAVKMLAGVIAGGVALIEDSQGETTLGLGIKKGLSC